MIRKIKAWFTNLVTAEVRRVLDLLHAEYENHIVKVFDRERDILLGDSVIIGREAEKLFKDAAEVVHQKILVEMKAKMDTELVAFEHRLLKTIEDSIKDEPAHWRADEQAILSDIELRTPKR